MATVFVKSPGAECNAGRDFGDIMLEVCTADDRAAACAPAVAPALKQGGRPLDDAASTRALRAAAELIAARGVCSMPDAAGTYERVRRERHIELGWGEDSAPPHPTKNYGAKAVARLQRLLPLLVFSTRRYVDGQYRPCLACIPYREGLEHMSGLPAQVRDEVMLALRRALVRNAGSGLFQLEKVVGSNLANLMYFALEDASPGLAEGVGVPAGKVAAACSAARRAIGGASDATSIAAATGACPAQLQRVARKAALLHLQAPGIAERAAAAAAARAQLGISGDMHDMIVTCAAAAGGGYKGGSGAWGTPIMGVSLAGGASGTGGGQFQHMLQLVQLALAEQGKSMSLSTLRRTAMDCGVVFRTMKQTWTERRVEMHYCAARVKQAKQFAHLFPHVSAYISRDASRKFKLDQISGQGQKRVMHVDRRSTGHGSRCAGGMIGAEQKDHSAGSDHAAHLDAFGVYSLRLGGNCTVLPADIRSRLPQEVLDGSSDSRTGGYAAAFVHDSGGDPETAPRNLLDTLRALTMMHDVDMHRDTKLWVFEEDNCHSARESIAVFCMAIFATITKASVVSVVSHAPTKSMYHSIERVWASVHKAVGNAPLWNTVGGWSTAPPEERRNGVDAALLELARRANTATVSGSKGGLLHASVAAKVPPYGAIGMEAANVHAFFDAGENCSPAFSATNRFPPLSAAQEVAGGQHASLFRRAWQLCRQRSCVSVGENHMSFVATSDADGCWELELPAGAAALLHHFGNKPPSPVRAGGREPTGAYLDLAEAATQPVPTDPDAHHPLKVLRDFGTEALTKAMQAGMLGGDLARLLAAHCCCDVEDIEETLQRFALQALRKQRRESLASAMLASGALRRVEQRVKMELRVDKVHIPELARALDMEYGKVTGKSRRPKELQGTQRVYLVQALADTFNYDKHPAPAGGRDSDMGGHGSGGAGSGSGSVTGGCGSGSAGSGSAAAAAVAPTAPTGSGEENDSGSGSGSGDARDSAAASSYSDESSEADEQSPQKRRRTPNSHKYLALWVGTKVAKLFPGHGVFQGCAESVEETDHGEVVSIRFKDGDVEDFDVAMMRKGAALHKQRKKEHYRRRVNAQYEAAAAAAVEAADETPP